MITVNFKKNVFPVIGIIISCYLMFIMPDAVAKGITDGLKICFYTVFTSLFPFMVLSSYIIKSDVLSPVYKVLSPVTKIIFRQPECTVPVIIMSLIGGFPVGTKMTASLLENGRITVNQSKRLCMFCQNGGPAFVITAVGSGMLGSRRAGVIMFISLCVSSLMIGFASSFFDDKKSVDDKYKDFAQSPLAALSASVSDNVRAALNICGWIVIFSALTECIKEMKFNDSVYTAVISVLEVTKGCTQSAKIMPIPIICGIIGFGGLCVHCQTFSFVHSTGLKYIRFFVGRVVSGALSALICHILLFFFPVDIATSLQNVSAVMPFSVSAPTFFAMIIMCIIMIFDIDTKKKIW